MLIARLPRHKNHAGWPTGSACYASSPDRFPALQYQNERSARPADGEINGNGVAVNFADHARHLTASIAVKSMIAPISGSPASINHGGRSTESGPVTARQTPHLAQREGGFIAHFQPQQVLLQPSEREASPRRNSAGLPLLRVDRRWCHRRVLA